MSCCSGEKVDPSELKANAQIETAVTQAQAEDKLVKKLLLLGAGESGKSTLFKQAQALYCAPYTPQEIKSYIPTIHNNIVQNIKTLIKFSSELKPPCPIKPANIKFKAVMDEVPMHCTSLTPQHAQAVTALWADEGIRATYTRRSEYQLNDSTAYFFQRVNDIVQPGYMPNNQDILRSRARTTGIVETTFVVEGKTFKMYDVGGQRNERKKWIHCFENVTALLFVAAISEYDQKLYEDETQNRMSETLSLFEEIVNSRWFRKTSIILFLNKSDLYEEKLKIKPITVCPEFEDYDGPADDFDTTTEYITERFHLCLDHNLTPNKQIYTHITCATDTEAMRVVFDAVKDIIIRKSLQDAGLLGP